MRTVSYTRAALKVLRRMPAPTRDRIKAKVRAYADDPASQANNVKALQGRSGIRLRIGDWRVVMDDRGAVLAVLKIGPRGSIYE